MSDKKYALLGFLPDVERRLKQLVEEGIAVPVSWVTATDASLEGVVINATFLGSPQIQKYIENVTANVVCSYRNDDGRQQADSSQVVGLDIDNHTPAELSSWLTALSGEDAPTISTEAAKKAEEEAYLSKQMQEIAAFTDNSDAQKTEQPPEQPANVGSNTDADVGTENSRSVDRQKPLSPSPFQSNLFGSRPTNNEQQQTTTEDTASPKFTQESSVQREYQRRQQEQLEAESEIENKVESKTEDKASMTASTADNTESATTAPVAEKTTSFSAKSSHFSSKPSVAEIKSQSTASKTDNAEKLSDNIDEFLETVKQSNKYLMVRNSHKTTWIDTSKHEAYLNYERDAIAGIDSIAWTVQNTPSKEKQFRRVQLDLWLFETIWLSTYDAADKITDNQTYQLTRWPRPLSTRGRSEALRLAAFAQTMPVTVEELMNKTGYSDSMIRRFLFAAQSAGQVKTAKLTERRVVPQQEERKPDKAKLSLLGRIRSKLGLG